VAITAFSNLTITISDGGTVPSLDYLSNKTYVDIGSGNILKISWNTPTATNNAVDNYVVNILKYDTATASYQPFYKANVGNVNEFYVKSSLFSSVQQSFSKLHIYVDVISKYGTAYNGTSNIELVSVSKGCGTYVRVEEGYTQPIMKRAIAFAKVDGKPIVANNGEPFIGSDGKTLYAAVSSVQDAETGWTLMQESYIASITDAAAEAEAEAVLVDANGLQLVDANELELCAVHTSPWQLSDIRYEVLTDANGEIITDINDKNVYVL
jgi:hypothetical protein